jgi:nicotinate-nucleotide--dimethylbenzimidazole phosphoribosyltransferase
MSIELTPFAEVTQPAGALSAGLVGDGPPDRTLGRLANVAGWFAARLADPGQIVRPRLVLIVGDHDGPVETAGSASDSDEVIARALADQAGVGTREVDVASRQADLEDEFVIVRGHRSPVAGDVLTREQAIAAIDCGRRIADQEIDAGADLLIPGLLGHGHAVAMGVIISVLTGLEPVDAIPLGDADLQTWSDGVGDLRDALFRLRDGDKDAISMLMSVGGADFAALAGLIAQAATRRTAVILDGLPATVSAVLAHRLAPGAESWFIATGEAATRRGRRLQELLWLPSVASLGTDSPAAAGALLVLPMIRAALAGRISRTTAGR